MLLWARLRKRKRLCSAQLPQQPYVYMALHYQPELTTSPLAGVYVEQELMVEQVAAALPQGWYVVVKEHPNQDIGRRSKDFYNYLAEIPNVVLLDTTYPAQDIIDSSKAIATATGTTAWETLFRGKPVLMFGNFFYRWAQGVFFVQNNNDVRAALQHIVSGTCVPQLSELRRYIAAIEAETIEAIVDSNYRRGNSPAETKNCERLLSSIFSLLEESV